LLTFFRTIYCTHFPPPPLFYQDWCSYVQVVDEDIAEKVMKIWGKFENSIEKDTRMNEAFHVKKLLERWETMKLAGSIGRDFRVPPPEGRRRSESWVPPPRKVKDDELKEVCGGNEQVPLDQLLKFVLEMNKEFTNRGFKLFKNVEDFLDSRVKDLNPAGILDTTLKTSITNEAFHVKKLLERWETMKLAKLKDDELEKFVLEMNKEFTNRGFKLFKNVEDFLVSRVKDLDPDGILGKTSKTPGNWADLDESSEIDRDLVMAGFRLLKTSSVHAINLRERGDISKWIRKVAKTDRLPSGFIPINFISIEFITIG
jgi:hypothetical protein